MIKETIKRFKSPTPEYWKKIRNGMITLGVIGGAIMTAPFELSPQLVTISQYCFVCGLVGGALSQLTAK